MTWAEAVMVKIIHRIFFATRFVRDEWRALQQDATARVEAADAEVQTKARVEAEKLRNMSLHGAMRNGSAEKAAVAFEKACAKLQKEKEARR